MPRLRRGLGRGAVAVLRLGGLEVHRLGGLGCPGCPAGGA